MKVEVRIRNDNERGLFAIENIKKGEYICSLPIDYISLNKKWYSLEKQTNIVSFRYGIRCDFSHTLNKKEDEYTKFLNFLGRKKRCLEIKKNTEIIGISNYNRIEEDLIGHMINDYVTMTMYSEELYKILSKKYENVIVKSDLELIKDKRLGLKIYARRNIKKDNELYFSYGTEYWSKYSNNEKKEIYKLSLNLIS